MAYKIIVRKRFTKKVTNLLSYLELNWETKVVKDFALKLKFRVDTISQQPYIGSVSKKVKNVRSIFITKHNRLYYRINDNTIEILNLYDTRINPNKNIYE